MDEVGNDNQGNYQQSPVQSMPQQGQASVPPIHHHKLAFIMGILVVVVVIAFIGAMLSVQSQSASSGSKSISAAPTSTAAPVSPKTMLINDLAAAKSVNNVQVSYLLNIPTLSQTNITLNMYMLGKSLKSIISLTVLGDQVTVANYNENNTNVTCTESALAPLSCSLSNVASTSFNASSYTTVNQAVINSPKVQTSYIGKSSVLGRACNEFQLTGSLSALSYASTSIAPENGTFSTYICVDNQTGIPLRMNISTTSYSKLLGKNQTALILSLTTTNISTGSVTNADMAIPVKVLIKGYNSPGSFVSYVNCTSSSVSFTVMPTVNLDSINVNGTTFRYVTQQNGTYTPENTVLFSANETGNYQAFSQYPMSFAVNNASQISSVNICADGSCDNNLFCRTNGSAVISVA
jgi:hypothetical protein